MGYRAPVFVADFETPYLQIRCRCGHTCVLDKDQVIQVMRARLRTAPRIHQLYGRLTCKACGRRGEIDIKPVTTPDGDRIRDLCELDDYVRLEVRCGCGNRRWLLVKDVAASLSVKGLPTAWDTLPGVMRCRSCGAKAAAVRVLGRERR